MESAMISTQSETLGTFSGVFCHEENWVKIHAFFIGISLRRVEI